MDDLDDDHVDFAELEANLYAQIHHDAPEAVEQYSVAQKLQQRLQHSGAPPSRVVTSSTVVNASAAGGPPKRGRYWSDGTAIGGGGGGYSHPKPAGPSTPAAAAASHKKRFNPFAAGPSAPTPTVLVPTAIAPSASAITADYRPKPFSPYTSYLSQFGSATAVDPTTATSTTTPSPTAIANQPTTTTNQQQSPPPPPPSSAAPQPRTNNKNSRNKNKKRKGGGEHTAGQLQQLDRARLAQELYQRGNAVQRLAQGKLKKSQQLRTKHERANGARLAQPAATLSSRKPPGVVTAIIDLDSDAKDDDDDDDDVICIPVEPPPLVCIESSDDEATESTGGPSPDATEAIADGDGDGSSIAEDFVGRRDRSRLSQCLDDDDAAIADAMGGLADSDLELNCATTVDDAIRCEQSRQQSPPKSSETATTATTSTDDPDADSAQNSPTSDGGDNCTTFVTPRRSRSSASALADRSYEVAENGFAAVDIYESESSDFPESVYEKGRPSAAQRAAQTVHCVDDEADASAAAASATAADTDSDVSSIQLNTVNRAKRRMKRKSSGSTKGSDHKSSEDESNDDSDGDDSNDGPAFVDIMRTTSTPYLQRGEAVANARSKHTRVPAVPPKRRRSLAGRAAGKAPLADAAQSDDEFMSMLSCIVHDDKSTADASAAAAASSASALTTTGDSADLEPVPTIDARAIVENVLSKVASNKSTAAGKKSKAGSEWMVTDEVGQSDEAATQAPESSKRKRKSSVGGGVVGKSTGPEFIVLDSVGETDPIPERSADTNNVVASVVASASSVVVVAAAEAASSTVVVTAKRAEPSTTTNAGLVPSAAAAALGEDSSDDNASVRSSSLVVDNPEVCWNDEMRSFYNESWGGEGYNQMEILRAMPKNRFHWTIADSDVFPSSPQQTRRFNRNIKCHNCREDGHRAAECYQPPKQIRCHMCGQAGHREPRCPNTLCLRCGNKTRMFNRGCQRCLGLASIPCPLCKVKGHSSRDCPDKWRRYHSTTKPNTPLTKLPIIYNKPKFCCVCASPGHLAEYCRNAFRSMDSPAQPIKVQSYEEAYKRIDASDLQPDGSQLDDVAPFALVSAPLQHYNFGWAVNESPDRVYGRIMSATQLQSQRPVFKRVSKKRKKTRSESLGRRSDRHSDKMPRTEISTSGGGRLVLNPLSAMVRDGETSASDAADATKDARIEVASDDAEPPIEDISAVMESLDDTVMEAAPIEPASADEMCDSANTTCEGDDAFAAAIDIDAVDEAVRQHMEKQTPSAAQSADANTVKSFKITVANDNTEKTAASVLARTVVPSNIDIETDGEDVELMSPHESVAVASAFSFIGALEEICQKNTDKTVASASFVLASIALDKVATPADGADTSAASTASTFSFIGALDDMCRTKAHFDIACLPETAPPTIVDDRRPSTPPPPTISPFGAAVEKKKAELETEMRRLNKEEAYLNNLKHELGKKKTPNKTRRISERAAVECADDAAVGYHVLLNEDIDSAVQLHGGAGQHNDSDSNYSFSEFFNKDAVVQPSVTSEPLAATLPAKLPPTTVLPELAVAPVQLPDFIPIGAGTDDGENEPEDAAYSSDEPSNRLTIAEDPSVAAAAPAGDEDDTSRYSEAKIYLSKDHSKYLMTRNGTAFLTETYTKHGVKLRMEWCNIGNILIVQGRPTAQDSFHADLLAYCTKVEADARKKQEISQQVPKNRLTLIRFIKEQISQLERPLGNVRECFLKMMAGEHQRSKAGTKGADRARKQLNMMLLGQTGLREGAMHLTALQSNLRCLVETETKEVISTVFRNEVFQHFKYIFSSVSHDNYAEMVHEYEAMRRGGRLPVLRLDRKLLGLKINVAGGATPAAALPDVVDVVAGAASAVETAAADAAPTSDVVVAGDEIVVAAATAAVSTTTTSIVPDVTTPTTKKCADVEKSTDTTTTTTTALAKTATMPSDAQTPKKPNNSFAKALAITASAKKATASDNTDSRMTEQEIVSELDSSLAVTRDAIPTTDRSGSGATDARKSDACASPLWSLKCRQYVDKCRAIPKIQNNENAMNRLLQVERKATDNKLSYTDYRMLMKIFDKCV